MSANKQTTLYLMKKGANKTAAVWAMMRIDEVCWSNRHFCKNHRDRRCTLDTNGFVKRFAVTVDIVFPDSGTTGTRRMVYTTKVAKSGKVTTNVQVQAA